MGQLQRSDSGLPDHLGPLPGGLRWLQPRAGGGTGSAADRSVRPRELPGADPAARPSPDRVLRWRALFPRRLEPPAHRGLRLSGRHPARHPGIFRPMVAKLARSRHQSRAHACGSLGISLAERDVPEAGPGCGLLQHRLAARRCGIPGQPHRAGRRRAPRRRGRRSEHRAPAPSGRHRFGGDRLPPDRAPAGTASGSVRRSRLFRRDPR